MVLSFRISAEAPSNLRRLSLFNHRCLPAQLRLTVLSNFEAKSRKKHSDTQQEHEKLFDVFDNTVKMRRLALQGYSQPINEIVL